MGKYIDWKRFLTPPRHKLGNPAHSQTASLALSFPAIADVTVIFVGAEVTATTCALGRSFKAVETSRKRARLLEGGAMAR
jgi:hypothetical protein